MKKWKLAIVGIIGIIIIGFMYQQHQTILKYRQIPYYSLLILADPIRQVIELHENATNYEDNERQEMLEDLSVEFSTISNKAGWGFTTEQKIRDEYYDKYIEARTDFTIDLNKYVKAATPEQREQAYRGLANISEILYAKALPKTVVVLIYGTLFLGMSFGAKMSQF